MYYRYIEMVSITLKNNIYLAVLGLCCCTGFSLVAMSRGCSLIVGHVNLSLCGFSCGAQALEGLGFSAHGR